MSRGPSSQAPHVAWSIVAGSRWPRERLAFSAPPESPSRFPGRLPIRGPARFEPRMPLSTGRWSQQDSNAPESC
eukprot:7911612-Pyramimonas_sp.AAC.1